MIIERVFDVDTRKPMLLQSLHDELCAGDMNAHCIAAHVTDREITGAVSGYFMRADGTTVLLDGSIRDKHRAEVVLNAHCYTVPGWAQLCVRVTQGDEVLTVLTLNMQVLRSHGEPLIDPENIVPSLDQLLGRMAEMERATGAADEAAERANAAANGVASPIVSILMRIQTEIKTCIRDTDVCPNAYIDQTDAMIDALVGSGDPVQPPAPDGPTDLTLTGITVVWSAETADAGAVTRTLIASVTAHYSDGTAQPVTEYTVSPASLSEGSNMVTVTHGGKTASKTITGMAAEGPKPKAVKSLIRSPAFNYADASSWYKDYGSVAAAAGTDYPNRAGGSGYFYSDEPFANDTDVDIYITANANVSTSIAQIYTACMIDTTGSSTTRLPSDSTFRWCAANTKQAYTAGVRTYVGKATAKAGLYFAVFMYGVLNGTVEIEYEV